MNIGNRIYYIRDTGVIIFQTGEISGDLVTERVDEVVEYIDIPFGKYDYSKEHIVNVNVETKDVEVIDIFNETDEQRRIRELEDILLLQAENEVGGIL